jgi:hypothetical protein
LSGGGHLQWGLAAVDVILRGQYRGAHTQAQHLLGKDRVIRIDPKVPDKLFALDKLSEKELLAKAAHVSRILAPTIAQCFQPHIATEYTPLYSCPTNKEGKE